MNDLYQLLYGALERQEFWKGGLFYLDTDSHIHLCLRVTETIVTLSRLRDYGLVRVNTECPGTWFQVEPAEVTLSGQLYREWRTALNG